MTGSAFFYSTTTNFQFKPSDKYIFYNKKYICRVMDEPMDFKSYLTSKKMNADQFQSAENKLYQELEAVFQEMHPDSFTAQKLFLINPLRRKYPLTNASTAAPAKPKMVMKPKFK